MAKTSQGNEDGEEIFAFVNYEIQLIGSNLFEWG